MVLFVFFRVLEVRNEIISVKFKCIFELIVDWNIILVGRYFKGFIWKNGIKSFLRSYKVEKDLIREFFERLFRVKF